MQCDAVQCSALQRLWSWILSFTMCSHVEVSRNVLQCVAVHFGFSDHGNFLSQDAVMLQCVAVFAVSCSVL